ncbi:hypothetical protein BDR26DRAFT_853583 [Obelidium mucronatum]|nr:hypothetical protein BDR26DRAFT_853583 [Obelidium mucronatum]
MDSAQVLPPVPSDVLEQVLMYLPLENLVSIALASKYFLTPLLLESHAFPKRHCTFQLALLHRTTNHGLDWDSSLPLKYKVVVFHSIMTSSDDRLDRDTLSSKRFTLHVGDLETVRVLEAMITQYPAFFPKYNNRILRQALLLQQNAVMQMLLTDSRLGFGSSGRLLVDNQMFGAREVRLIHQQETSQDTLVLALEGTKDIGPAWLSLVQDRRIIISDNCLRVAAPGHFWLGGYRSFYWGFDFWDAILKNPNTVAGSHVTETLLDVCQQGDVVALKSILANGHVTPSVDTNTAIQLAHYHKNLEVVDVLLGISHIKLSWHRRIFYRYYRERNINDLGFAFKYGCILSHVTFAGMRKAMSTLGSEYFLLKHLQRLRAICFFLVFLHGWGIGRYVAGHLRDKFALRWFITSSVLMTLFVLTGLVVWGDSMGMAEWIYLAWGIVFLYHHKH